MRQLAPLSALLLLFACSGDPAPAAGGTGGTDGTDGTDGADGADGTEDDGPTEPWGLTLAEDHDPDPNVVEVHLTAGKAEVEWVDGRPTEVWAYNGLVPGPLIQATVGDTVRVILDNQLDDATTIHWHGLRIPDVMDGVPAMQDPVEPGGTFTYEFVVPDSGTFWYHPHMRANEQIEHGLQGMLIVREADGPTPAEERAFVLDDVYLTSSGGFGSFLSSHPEQMHGRFGNRLLLNGQDELLEGTVRPGAPERWRIVNTANARMMAVEVEGADWRIIAIDGTLLPEPLFQDRMRMPVGRRLDLEVIPHADAEAVELQVQTLGETYTLFSAEVEGDAGDGAWLDWPAEPLPEIQETVQDVELTFGVTSDADGLVWMINGVPYSEAEDILVDGGVPSRIVVQDTTGAEHPFHLHGQFFQVMSRDGELLERDGGQLDTVLIGPRETLELYTGFENPGRWMAHCHILEHAELGMMAELVVSE